MLTSHDETAAFYTATCNHSLRTITSLGTPISLHVCSLKGSLSNDTQLLLTIAELIKLHSVSWNQRTRICVVLSIEQGTWNNWIRSLSLSLYIYILYSVCGWMSIWRLKYD